MTAEERDARTHARLMQRSKEELIEIIKELRKEYHKSQRRVRQLTLKEDLDYVAQKYTGSFGQWMQSQVIEQAFPTQSPASDTAASGQSPPPGTAPRSR